MKEHAACLVDLRAVTIRKGKQAILENIDFSVFPGEIVTILGPNGAGKTTLARVALGLEKPATGVATRRAGLRIGYLPQKVSVDPILPLTVRRLMTLSFRAAEREISAALDEVGGLALRDAPVHRLSGGELQRVMLARALLAKPDLLVLDEPTQGIDVVGQLDLYDLVSHLKVRHGCAVMMISHDVSAAMAHTDRAIYLQTRILFSGLADEIMHDPLYRWILHPPGSERRCMEERESGTRAGENGTDAVLRRKWQA